MLIRSIQTFSILVISVSIGCANATQEAENPDANTATSSTIAGDLIVKFKDSVESNAKVPEGLDELVFVDTGGQSIPLKDFFGKKNVVLVFTKGFFGKLCPFCQTQTSRLVANYEKFMEQEAEVLVVYPGPRDHLEEFMEAAMKTDKQQIDAVPFPIVLDEDFKATIFFGIKGEHAYPSTFIIDKQGKIQLAYVGADLTIDRPSVKAIVDKLQEINR